MNVLNRLRKNEWKTTILHVPRSQSAAKKNEQKSLLGGVGGIAWKGKVRTGVQSCLDLTQEHKNNAQTSRPTT